MEYILYKPITLIFTMSFIDDICLSNIYALRHIGI